MYVFSFHATITWWNKEVYIIDRHVRNIDTVRNSLWRLIGPRQCFYMLDMAMGPSK